MFGLVAPSVCHSWDSPAILACVPWCSCFILPYFCSLMGTSQSCAGGDWCNIGVQEHKTASHPGTWLHVCVSGMGRR